MLIAESSTELFDNYLQQDAHEFLNYLLNTIGDLLQGFHSFDIFSRSWTCATFRLFFRKTDWQQQKVGTVITSEWHDALYRPVRRFCSLAVDVGSWNIPRNSDQRDKMSQLRNGHSLTKLFHLLYSRAYRVFWQQVSSKDEDFLDLSLDVEQNTSLTNCLLGFSNTETLCSECKYYCEVCCSKQEAQRRCDVIIICLYVTLLQVVTNLM